MAAEVALAVVLSIAAGLLARSFVAVLNTDPGFRSDHLLTMMIGVPARYNTDEQRVAFYRQLFQRLEAVPGVIAVGGNTRLPFAGANSSTQVAVEGRIPPEGQWPETDFRRAVHRYFETMGIPVIRGRGFTAEDRAGAPPVVVINETLAKRMFGDEDPIGRQLRLGPSSPVRRATVVGIVGDLRHQRLDVAPAPEVYINYLQGPPVSPLPGVSHRGRSGAAGRSPSAPRSARSTPRDRAVEHPDDGRSQIATVSATRVPDGAHRRVRRARAGAGGGRRLRRAVAGGGRAHARDGHSSRARRVAARARRR